MRISGKTRLSVEIFSNSPTPAAQKEHDLSNQRRRIPGWVGSFGDHFEPMCRHADVFQIAVS